MVIKIPHSVEESLQSFVSEAEALLDLGGTGGAPRLRGVAQLPFALIMEFCPGITLQHFLDKCTEDEVVTLFPQIVESVESIHRNGYRHGDLKPSNIIVDNTNEDLVIHPIDFGIARKCGNSRDEVDQEISWLS